MNKINKFLMSIMMLLLMVLALNINNVQAASSLDKETNFNGAKYREKSVVERNELLGGVVHTKYVSESLAIRDRDDDYVGITTANTYYPQSVNVLEVPANQEVKIVQWAHHTDSSPEWALTTVEAMANNYEEHNPGYKVVAAVNGDYFDIDYKGSYGSLLKTVMGVSVSDGEVIRAKDARGDNALTIGFKNNGQSDNFVQGGKIEFSTNHFLALYDEDGNLTGEFEISSINSEPKSGELAVYFSYPTGVGETKKEQGYRLVTIPGNNAYICETPTRIVPSEKDSLYALGSLSEASKTTELKWGTFGIITNNQEIRKQIDQASFVRVQKNVIGDYADCESIGGGVFALLQDGKDLASGLDANRHPRTMIGAREDGTIILATVDGRQKPLNMYGMTGEEEGALMKHYGCVNAVNVDGGGSTTILIRNQDGKFDVKNSPSDGSLRKDANCYLVVMRKADFEINETIVLPNSITFKLDISHMDQNKVEQIKCTLNGQTLVVKNNQVTFDKLTNNTEYDYSFSYDTEDEKDIKTALFGKIYSSKLKPEFGKLKIQKANNKIIFTPEITDLDESLDYFRILINGKRNPYLGEPIEVKIDLTNNPLVEFDILISYDLNDGLGKVEVTKHVVYDSSLDEDYVNIVDEIVNDGTDDEKGCKKDLSVALISTLCLVSTALLLKKKER